MLRSARLSLILHVSILSSALMATLMCQNQLSSRRPVAMVTQRCTELRGGCHLEYEQLHIWSHEPTRTKNRQSINIYICTHTTHRQQGIAILPHLPLPLSHSCSDDDDEPTLFRISSTHWLTVCLNNVDGSYPTLLLACAAVQYSRSQVQQLLSHMTTGEVTWCIQADIEGVGVCVCVCVCVCVFGIGMGWDVCVQLLGWRWQHNIMWSRLWTKSGPAGLAARWINCWMEGVGVDAYVRMRVCV